MNKVREKIELTSDSLRDLVYTNHLVIDGKEIEIKEIENKYISSGRHQEYYYMIFERLSDHKFFKTNYSESTQDMMDWDECNYNFEAIEVFPETVSKIIYK